MEPYFSLLNNGYNGFRGKVTVTVQVSIDSTKPMVSQIVSDKISGSQDNKRIESEIRTCEKRGELMGGRK